MSSTSYSLNLLAKNNRQQRPYRSERLLSESQGLVRHCVVVVGGGDVDSHAADEGASFFPLLGVVHVDDRLSASAMDVGHLVPVHTDCAADLTSVTR